MVISPKYELGNALINMMIKLVNFFFHFRSRNTKSRPRPGEVQANKLNPTSRPLFVYRVLLGWHRE
ncbi:N-acetyltransferase eco [Gossypium arboreum]|uniref:N-acetyltransferase eco n=1 Tax=Gossypium arboreum TaxID=29729 RepID=A0A0B0N0W4_GOSAR|nr:N-acetyltransferase eco [Gossypium arboreum]